jgi:hypothetical protein
MKKGQQLQNGWWGLVKNCRVGRSRHAAHFCNLNLTSISYSFWNIRWKVLKFRKNDDEKKGNNSKIGNQIYFTIAGWVDLDMLHISAIWT